MPSGTTEAPRYEAERQEDASLGGGSTTGAAADSVSGDRVIEVKAFGGSARGQDLWLEPRQVEEADANPSFWLYVVEYVRDGADAATVPEIGGEQLSSLLSRKREHRYFTVPLPVAVYGELHRR